MTMNGDFNREVRFEIVESIGVLTSHSTGWRKELNLVSWNGGQPKYDIRDWSPDHAHMSRGVTLHEKEMRHIFDLLKQRRRNDRRRSTVDSAAVSANLSSAEAPPVPAPAGAPPEDFDDDFDSMKISEDGEAL